MAAACHSPTGTLPTSRPPTNSYRPPAIAFLLHSIPSNNPGLTKLNSITTGREALPPCWLACHRHTPRPREPRILDQRLSPSALKPRHRTASAQHEARRQGMRIPAPPPRGQSCHCWIASRERRSPLDQFLGALDLLLPSPNPGRRSLPKRVPGVEDGPWQLLTQRLCEFSGSSLPGASVSRASTSTRRSHGSSPPFTAATYTFGATRRKPS